VEFTIIIFGSTVSAIVDLPESKPGGGPASAQAARKSPSTAESVFRAPEKDTVDEYFLHASAASQQEPTAGPGAWDQIRAREGIVAVFHL
jgi:hypothetical protein